MTRAAIVIALAAGWAVLVAEPAARAQEGDRRPEVWAIVVGINAYEQPAIPDCRGAIRDARVVARWFRETAGWGPGHVLELNDSGLAAVPDRAEGQIPLLRPTRGALDWAAREWLRPRARPGDLIVFYFAGQAVALPPPEDAPFGAPAGDALLPIDARPGDLPGSSWSPDEAFRPIASKGENPLILWLDTSPGGRGAPVPGSQDVLARGGGEDAGGAESETPGHRFLRRLTRWPKVVAWMAASGRPSDDAPGAEVGPFVASLAEALGSAAEPRSIAEALARLRNDERLAPLGFLSVGGVPSYVNLWVRALRAPARPEPELVLQRGHADAVSGLALAPDARTLVSGSTDSTVRVWGAADRVLRRVLSGHRIGVTALALGPDGRRLVSADGQGLVVALDLADGRTAASLRPVHRARVERLVALPDGRHFASIDLDGVVALWDAGGATLAGSAVALGDGRVAALAAAPPAGDGGGDGAGVAWAIATEEGALTLLGVDGKEVRSVAVPTRGPGQALLLTAGGRRAAVGDEAGTLVVIDAGEGAEVARLDLGGTITTIAADAGGRLAVGAGDSVHLVSIPDAGGAPEVRPFDAGGTPREVLLSPDGRVIAIRTDGGAIRSWTIAGEAAPRPMLDVRPTPPASSLALAPGADRLIVGDAQGGLRFWDLPEGLQVARVPPSRGRVTTLGVSADGSTLLQVTREDVAMLWDLEGARGARALPGPWQSGALVRFDGKDHAALVGRVGVEGVGGRVALMPIEPFPRAGAPVATLPAAVDGRPVMFARAASSPDGLMLAAIEDEAFGRPVAFLWDLRPGDRERIHSLRPEGVGDAFTTVAFGTDGRSLLLGAKDGRVVRWEIGPDGPSEAPTVLPPAPGPGPSGITAVAADPARAGRIASADDLGVVRLWTAGRDAPDIELERLGQAVHALAFTRDGRALAAAADDGEVLFWTLDGPPRRVRARSRDGHTERVNALVSWPIPPPAEGDADAPAPRPGGLPARAEQMIVSGADDTTIRFWDPLAAPTRADLLGTLSAVASEDIQGAGDGALGIAPRPVVDWVTFAPDGRFDGSPRGQDQIRFVLGDDVLAPEQAFDRLYEYRLSDGLRRGRRPGDAPELPTAPALAIDEPPGPTSPSREVELSLSIGEPDPETLASLRLYHDSTPVAAAPGDFEPVGPGRFRARVRLHHGVNRFYAMASPPGRDGFDVRSGDVQVRFEGPDRVGRLHVLALGVSAYNRRALEFADDDATAIADELIARVGGGGRVAEPGEKIVLTDRRVSDESVRDAFEALDRAIDGRPEDTVVVFLAGHTDVFDDRFHLLLPDFPFPADDPVQVASRGPAEAKPERLEPGQALPYFDIYRRLSRLKALQRLVIVDACQAEAIYDDRGVEVINRAMARDSLRAKLSYIMAARRGEEAGEAASLGHGLLTYALLRGLDAPLAGTQPEDLADLFVSSADADRDRIVTTEELRSYVDATLPPLAERYPTLALRGEPGRGPAVADADPGADLQQRLRLQGTPPPLPDTPAFPLVELDLRAEAASGSE